MSNYLGEYIKEYRAKHGLSLREFGKIADVSHTHVDSIERGADHPDHSYTRKNLLSRYISEIKYS